LIKTNLPFYSKVYLEEEWWRLTGSTLVLLAEEDELGLVVDGQDTGTGNTTEGPVLICLSERLT
jgi:hypothetical protein